MTKDEALKMALEALEANYQLINGTDTNGGLIYCIDGYYSDCFDEDPVNEQTEEAITAIKEALAQPEQEPVAWQLKPHPEPEEGDYIEVIARWGKRFVEMPNPIIGGNNLVRFYFDPPQRTWVGLTKEQLATTDWSADFRAGALWAEAKLKQKNGYEEKNT